MSKLILTGLAAAAALGLAACGETREENLATENVEDLNATEDLNMDMDMNTDMNMDTNAADMNAADMNAVGNAADGNSTGY
jgi:outer membrane murein-binding lipoprotein Lpp